MQQDVQITTSAAEAEQTAASCCGGACCGGGASSEPSAQQAQAFSVEGMTCGHCSSAVSAELSELEGVRAVRIDVVAGGRSTVTVEADAPLDVERVRAAVDEAGYTLVD